MLRSREALTASPSAPIASRWRSQSIGTAIEMYWWIRANVSGCTRDAGPFGADNGSSSSPAIMRRALPPSISRSCLSSKPASFAVRVGHEQRVRLAAVRVVGRVHHLLGGDLAIQVEEVEAAPDGRVEEDAADAAEPSGQAGHVGDARVRDDQLDALVPPDERLEVLRDRRKPATAVDEDRHGPLDREREDRLQPLVVERERLRARVQLDPARAEVEAAPRLLERLCGEVEPDEGDERSARALGVGERAVVRAR